MRVGLITLMKPGERFSEAPKLFGPISGAITHTASCKQRINKEVFKHENLLEVNIRYLTDMLK